MPDDLHLNIKLFLRTFQEHHIGIKAFEENHSLRVQEHLVGNRGQKIGGLRINLAVADDELPRLFKIQQNASFKIKQYQRISRKIPLILGSVLAFSTL